MKGGAGPPEPLERLQMPLPPGPKEGRGAEDRLNAGRLECLPVLGFCHPVLSRLLPGLGCAGYGSLLIGHF